MKKNKAYIVFLFISCILISSCKDTANIDFVKDSEECELCKYSIQLPSLLRKGEQSTNAAMSFRIDSSITLLPKETVLQIFEGAVVSKSNQEVMPVIGDGLCYHAILKFKRGEELRNVYFYRVLYKEGFYSDSQDRLYQISFSHKARKTIDSLISDE